MISGAFGYGVKDLSKQAAYRDSAG